MFRNILANVGQKIVFSIVGIVAFFIYMSFKGGSDGTMREDRSRESRYNAVLEPFAQAIFDRDWKAAYALTSSQLQKTMTLEDFIDAHEKARMDYGIPIKFEPGWNTTDPQEMIEDEYDLPEEIAQSTWRAWGYVSMALEVDEDGEFYRCYDCYVLIVDDGGSDKIGHFEFEWCD